MKISELQARQGKVDLTADVVEVGEQRTFNKDGNEGRVANATIKDDSGQIKLTLWNEQVDQVKAGDKIEIKNGYVSEFQGELQLTSGKFGTLKVIKGDDSSSSSDDGAQESVSASEESAPIAEPASGSTPKESSGINQVSLDGDDLSVDEERVE